MKNIIHDCCISLIEKQHDNNNNDNDKKQHDNCVGCNLLRLEFARSPAELRRFTSTDIRYSSLQINGRYDSTSDIMNQHNHNSMIITIQCAGIKNKQMKQNQTKINIWIH